MAYEVKYHVHKNQLSKIMYTFFTVNSSHEYMDLLFISKVCEKIETLCLCFSVSQNFYQ